MCQLESSGTNITGRTYRHEENHTANAEESTNIIDLTENLSASKASAIDTRRREIEDSCHYEANEVPDAAKKTDPAPCAVVGDKLAPEDRWAEWNNGKDEDGYVFAAL